MGIATYIKNRPLLKRLSLWVMIPSNQQRPRRWIKWFVNPFVHNRGKHVVIRKRTRTDVFPYNSFDVGDYTVIEDFATINNGVGGIQIGKHSIIGIGNVIIGPVSIGNNVMLAQNIVISGLNHGYQDTSIPPRKQAVNCELICVEDNVWIGANSVVTAGVTIGRHAVVGAGSVVTRDVPPYAVVVGNPARVIKQYNKETETWERVN